MSAIAPAPTDVPDHILADALIAQEGGESIEQIVSRYPEHAAALRAFFSVAETLQRQQFSISPEVLTKTLDSINQSSIVTHSTDNRYLYHNNQQAFIHKWISSMQTMWKAIVPIGIVAVIAIVATVALQKSPTQRLGQPVQVAHSNGASANTNTSDTLKVEPTNPAPATVATAGSIDADIDAALNADAADQQQVLTSFDDADMATYDSAEAASFDGAYNEQDI